MAKHLEITNGNQRLNKLHGCCEMNEYALSAYSKDGLGATCDGNTLLTSQQQCEMAAATLG
jgi:hypothetical protein